MAVPSGIASIGMPPGGKWSAMWAAEARRRCLREIRKAVAAPSPGRPTVKTAGPIRRAVFTSRSSCSGEGEATSAVFSPALGGRSSGRATPTNPRGDDQRPRDRRRFSGHREPLERPRSAIGRFSVRIVMSVTPPPAPPQSAIGRSAAEPLPLVFRRAPPQVDRLDEERVEEPAGCQGLEGERDQGRGVGMPRVDAGPGGPRRASRPAAGRDPGRGRAWRGGGSRPIRGPARSSSGRGGSAGRRGSPGRTGRRRRRRAGRRRRRRLRGRLSGALRAIASRLSSATRGLPAA